MNLAQLAEKIENYELFNSYENIILYYQDVEYGFVIKRSNGFVIIGSATWGDYDNWAFNNPVVFPNVYDALQDIEESLEESIMDVFGVDSVEYSFIPDEYCRTNILVYDNAKRNKLEIE